MEITIRGVLIADCDYGGWSEGYLYFTRPDQKDEAQE